MHIIYKRRWNFFLFLVLVDMARSTSPKTITCTKDSKEVNKSWKYESVSCQSQTVEWLCKYSSLIPKYAVCLKENSEWQCEASNDWIADVSMSCPKDHSPCSDSLESCKIIYDPLSSILYLLSIILVFTICCMFICCVFGGAYATQCFFMIDTNRPSYIEMGIRDKRIKRRQRVQ